MPPYLLLRREVSKEHRKDPIVQMELFMDTNGLPISYGLFSGNTLDKQTLIPMMGKLKEGFRIKSRLAPKKSVGIRGQKVFCPLMPTDCSAFHAPAILKTFKIRPIGLLFHVFAGPKVTPIQFVKTIVTELSSSFYIKWAKVNDFIF